jgi:hypothetical protein
VGSRSSSGATIDRVPGKLSATYELPTRDIHVIEPGPFTTQLKGPQPATATLKCSRRGFRLIIEIETDDPTSASDMADSYAAQLAEHLTLWFCDRVKRAVVARRTDRQFQGTDANTLHAFPGEVVLVGHAMRVRITAIAKVKTLQDALSDFGLRLAAPPPVFATDIVIARQMYFAALKAENRASRFLIIYTALAVFSTFKLGTRGGTQDRIDRILTSEDPTLPMATPPGRTRAETEFTKARNEFLHAEERGRIPATALAIVEGLTPRLQSLAGRILRKG